MVSYSAASNQVIIIYSTPSPCGKESFYAKQWYVHNPFSWRVSGKGHDIGAPVERARGVNCTILLHPLTYPPAALKPNKNLKLSCMMHDLFILFILLTSSSHQ
jgi:hypothetical protein